MAAIPLIWFGGIFVAIVVHRTRSGIPFFARLSLIGPHTGWMIVQSFKSIVWPAVLVAWFLRGRPGPRIVFGQKAERMRLEQQQSMIGHTQLPLAGDARTE